MDEITQTSEQMLRQFHESKAIHGGLMPEFPTVDIPDWVRALRLTMLLEEIRELAAAVEAGDITAIADGIADGIADVVYVAVGTAVVHGIPFDAVFAEVHRSNMTKDNSPAEGKLVKGPGYEPPRIAEVLTTHGAPGLTTKLECGCEVRLGNVACWYHNEREGGVAYPGCGECQFAVTPAVHRCAA